MKANLSDNTLTINLQNVEVNEFDFLVKFIRLMNLLYFNLPLAAKECEFLAMLIIGKRNNIHNPLNMSQIYEKYSEKPLKKQDIYNYIQKLKKKKWIDYEDQKVNVFQIFLAPYSQISLDFNLNYGEL